MKHVCPDDPVLLKEFNDEVNRLKVVFATRILKNKNKRDRGMEATS